MLKVLISKVQYAASVFRRRLRIQVCVPYLSSKIQQTIPALFNRLEKLFGICDVRMNLKENEIHIILNCSLNMTGCFVKWPLIEKKRQCFWVKNKFERKNTLMNLTRRFKVKSVTWIILMLWFNIHSLLTRMDTCSYLQTWNLWRVACIRISYQCNFNVFSLQVWYIKYYSFTWTRNLFSYLKERRYLVYMLYPTFMKHNDFIGIK